MMLVFVLLVLFSTVLGVGVAVVVAAASVASTTINAAFLLWLSLFLAARLSTPRNPPSFKQRERF